jgi:hypothetical protein
MVPLSAYPPIAYTTVRILRTTTMLFNVPALL